MIDLDKDIEAEAKKIDEKIKKLQEQKKELAEKVKNQKQKTELARKVGLLVLSFDGKSFDYAELEKMFDEKLTSDFDRSFFGLKELAENDSRKPKKRGRKKAE